jgi:solute carrier family 35 (UDP-sugar transporter), member A1/2/3
MSVSKNKASNFFRAQLLFLLAVQNTSVILVTHFASHKTPGQESTYSVSTAIFCVELLKCLICIAVIIYQKGISGLIKDIDESVVKRPQGFLALSIPSFLYVIQNNLNMVAIGNLPPAIYTVVYQLKVFSAAIINVIFFKRVLGLQKWLAIATLFIGVVLAQWKHGDSGSKVGSDQENQSYMLGLTCALCATVTSGVAGTFMEWAMKSTKNTSASDVLHTWEPTMWTKNVALAFFGVVGSSIAMMTKDRAKILEYGVFNDFKTSLYFAIILQAGGGLLVGAVLKYADNIIKGFVTSVGVIFASLASVYLFNFVITSTFVVGAVIVFLSLHVYNSKRNYLAEYKIIKSDVNPMQ